MKRIPTLSIIAIFFALISVTLGSVDQVQVSDDSSMVYVNVTATTRQGQFVTGLPKEAFRIFEDNVQQNIVHFAEENRPIAAIVLMDVSDDMKNRIRSMLELGLSKSIARNDELSFREVGKTPLNDAVLQALNSLLQRGKDKKRVLM